jgi:hypothetical protein
MIDDRPYGIRTPSGWWEILYADHETASMDAEYKRNTGDLPECDVVELVPLQEVERMIANAVHAERSRCAAIAEAQVINATPKTSRGDTTDKWAARTAAEMIVQQIIECAK